MLNLENLCKDFKDVKAVNNVTFSMEKGVYGLLGANGAGKTTLMRMLTTLLRKTSGRIFFGGEDIIEMGENYRKLIGYLPQEFGYYPEFSAEDYLLYIASLKGLKRGYAKIRTKELLEMVSLWQVRKKKVRTFSGGMKRRLGIAQAILNDPKILILDEPTSGLDPKERIRFRNIISTLAEDRIILLSTHIVSDIESIANEIIIMKEGSIIAMGNTEELVRPLENMVWKCVVTQMEAARLQGQYIVSNLKTSAEGVVLRIISMESPVGQAQNVVPTLEDLFMYYFGEVVGENDDVLV